ncbi:MAG: threonine/serine exporter family protein [Synergistaceae bacterium]|nr:threonine/serine exporter family protein [Synergistaceae bacterium]
MTGNIDDILIFCVDLSRQMIISGANLERIQTAVDTICRAYGLSDVSLFLLSTHISLSAVDSEGNYSSRQASIPAAGIHLERLRSLNQLSYKIAEITPNPKTLSQMLERAMHVKDYSEPVIIAGKLCAMLCLSFMFGGTFNEIVPIALVTVIIHYFMSVLEKTGLDRIVTNALTMFTAAVAAVGFVYSGIGDNLPAILITVTMIVIPGIPLVNAMRNLLCGREINGILQMLKIFIETMALGLGIYSALAIFKNFIAVNNAPPSALPPIVMTALSFMASVGFGIVFMIPPKDLWLAGLGGAMARIALLVLTPLISNRLLFMTLSASVAALYAEFLAVRRKQPSTYLLYPSIIPLIPGDLFFYSLSGLFLGDRVWVETNGINCLLSLAGLSIGFVLSSAVAIHVRRSRIR